MSGHVVDVAGHVIPGRHILHAAECRDCDWRSREYRSFERANEAADRHVRKTTPKPEDRP